MTRDKLIINVALTGMIPTRDMNHNVPLTPEEIAEDARRVCALGASMLHVHARDKDGNPSSSPELYREIIARIRENCGDVIITVSTSGRKEKSLERRMQVLSLDGDEKPDMASLTLGSMNFIDSYTLNTHEVILTLLEEMQARGIRPELEIFDSGMAHFTGYLVRKGHLKGTQYANLLLGSLGTIPATPKHLMSLVDDLPEGVVWAATGLGRFALPVQNLAIAMGGHVRVGLEDSIYLDYDREVLATNEALVRRVVDLAAAMGREVATPKEARTMLALS